MNNETSRHLAKRRVLDLLAYLTTPVIGYVWLQFVPGYSFIFVMLIYVNAFSIIGRLILRRKNAG